jgi:hypothetical protein
MILLISIIGCDQNQQQANSAVDQAANDTTAETAQQTEPSPTTPEPETSEPETVTRPESPQVEIRLTSSYLRHGVNPQQHYVKVEQILAGPTPCQQDSLLVIMENMGLDLQWQSDERLEIYGAYETEAANCWVSLSQPSHAIKTLPQPEPVETETIPEETTQSQPPDLVEGEPPAPSVIHIQATMSALRAQTAFFIVDRVFEGEFDCVQVSLELVDPIEASLGSEYDILGLYDAGEANCQLRLANPLEDVRLLTPPIPPAATEAVPDVSAPSGAVDVLDQTVPFHFSAGVALVEDIPVFSGAAGFSLSPELKGMGSFGMGSGEIELTLPSGEPFNADLSIMLIEAAALYRVSGPFHIGASGGVMLLSGDYQLPYPVNGSTKFNATIPVLGVVLGYEFGLAMATVSVSIALGG